MKESQNIEWKESWRDEYLKWICGFALIEKCLRNKNTIEFLGIWEEVYNADFNSSEFEEIKNMEEAYV